MFEKLYYSCRGGRLSTVFEVRVCVIFSFVKILMLTFYYSPAMGYWHVCKTKIKGYFMDFAAFPKCDRFRESYSHHTVTLWTVICD